MPLGTLFMSRMTWCHVFWQIGRPMFYFSIVYATHLYTESKYPEFKYSWWLGVFVMCIFYILLRIVFEIVLDMKHLGTFDELYLYDPSVNKSIITAILYFDKFDDKMLTHLKNRMLKYKRLRSKFVQFLDQYYLKEYTFDELIDVTEDAFVKATHNHKGDPLTNDQALVDFLTHESGTPFDENSLWYKVVAVENYSEKKSAIMFKCHHALADGMSLIGLIASM